MNVERVHVMPDWEKHVSSTDCWCEPRIDGNVVIHDATTCSRNGDIHDKHCYRTKIYLTDGIYLKAVVSECVHCGQGRPRCGSAEQ